ncbi:DNA segregation ATPase FtsK/SpoIIIE, S-DNA-T family [Butyrivibrio sp. ob235]|uniref:type VII secretion protein EssC n=1 Tax=Butyrivibrio sp. ob235 TaxID=1761780 RepID=UPI0008CFE7E3|nr:type VII secretion protein EssC [Butyrivibrio sp. ob235]SEM28657.1 DNA segregation ATPase FtsK/SpoIIIE, S-DNA-T family [Butyrivibrio sp. ob235]
MSFLVTTVFENGFCELYLPDVDNKTVPLEIKPYISGRDDDVILPLEVWDGVWTLTGGGKFTITQNETKVDKVTLVDGLFVNCEFKDGQVFSLTAEEVAEGNTQFKKYLLGQNNQSPIVIGKDASNTISYNNKFVSPKHAQISFTADGAIIKDLDSMNGTFVNGRMLQGEKKLIFGDVIYIIGLKIIFLGSTLAINNPKEACQVNGIKEINITTTGGGDDNFEEEEEKYFLRTPRKLEVLDTETITLEKCPPKQKQEKQPLLLTIGPSFTMIIPMALGATLAMGDGFAGAGVVMSAGAAVVGAIWAIVNTRYQDKVYRQAEMARVKNFENYTVEMQGVIKDKMEYNSAVLARTYPSVNEAADIGIGETSRLWEKSWVHDDFLDVRLGTGDIPSFNKIETSKEQAMQEHDPLNKRTEDIKLAMAELKGVPVSLSLYKNRFVGIVSPDRPSAIAIARTMTVQIASAHPYTDVRMCMVFPSKERDNWNYMRFLPHIWSPDGKLRLMCCDKNSIGDVMYFMSGIIRDRIEKTGKEAGKDDHKKILPHYVFVIADYSLVAEEPICKYLLNPTEEMGISVVMLADAPDKLPSGCTTIVTASQEECGFVSTINAFPARHNVSFDNLPPLKAETFARKLSGIHLRETGVSTAIPDMLTFLDMYKTSNIESLDIYHRWLENRTYESMRAMIGYKSGNQPLFLDIHEKYHGPHGLVAGTTGSGKSETLQSYILSLAINYHPDEVAFILIDYKGGGMAQSFEGLPHVSGVITNLGGNATNRALLSINAEIKHRQKLFNEFKVKHIDAYIELYRSGIATEPMPHLLIIADEFAELKKEQPEFVRSLVSAARVGRSLGVNLILATQKPSGVVDDEIWSNTRFRLCLRVADKGDSNEMLKRPDAAYITGTGRGFFQVGSDEIFEEFQSGWSGAEYEPGVPFTDEKNAKVELINLIGKNGVPKKKDKNKKSDNIKKLTQLDAIVKYTAEIAKEHNIAAVRQIWLPALKNRIYLSDLETEKSEGFSLRLPVGIADNPEIQSQYTAYVDFLSDGNLLICGASGSGKTTLLQTIIYGAVTNYSASDVNIYILDFSSRTMAVFSAMPHIGSICFDGEDEKLNDTFEFFMTELTERKKKFAGMGIGSYKEYVQHASDCPALLLIIDNFVAFYENYDRFEDDLSVLTREGASYGIYTVITTNGSSDLRSRLRQNFGTGIGLQMPDRFEYEAVVGDHTEIVPEGKTPGRGLIKAPGCVEFQVALPVPETDGLSQAQSIKKSLSAVSVEGDSKGAKKPGQTLDSLSIKDLLNDAKALPENRLAVGKTVDGENIISFDMDKEYCISLIGLGETGKTNLLKAIALEVKDKGSEVIIFDGKNEELKDFAAQNGISEYITDDAGLFKLMQNEIVPKFGERNKIVNDAKNSGTPISDAMKDQKRIMVLINDYSYFIETVYSEEYGMNGFFETALEKGRDHKIYFIAAMTNDDVSDCAKYKVSRQFTEMESGVNLGGMFDQQSVLHFEMSSADAVRQLPAGFGFALLDDGTAVRMITPLV